MFLTVRRALQIKSVSESGARSDHPRVRRVLQEIAGFAPAAAVLVAIALAGCSASQEASQEAGASGTKVVPVGDAPPAGNFEVNRVFRTLPVARFAGQVTIDGQPPKEGTKLFVILTDPKHLDENGQGTLPKLYATCDAKGNFAFGTYDLKDKNDGVVAGSYVVTFVNPHKFVPRVAKKDRSKSPAASTSERRRPVQYAPPDDLKNLYNDPDQNINDARFNLALAPPGRDNYHFDLAVGGKEPAKPAPHAVRFMTLSE
jgi:hypothetical protein